jgi:hypothetical protein
MKKLLLTLVAVVALVATPLAGVSGKKVTVGDFAVKVSQALGFKVVDRTAAVRTLEAAGVALGGNLDEPLTERVAADILGSLGVKVATLNPSDLLSPGKVDALVTSLALTSLGAPGIGTLPPPPTQCRDILKKNGQIDKGKCVKCCKMAIMSADSKDKGHQGRHSGKVCDRFCKTGEFPSPSEPEF